MISLSRVRRASRRDALRRLRMAFSLLAAIVGVGCSMAERAAPSNEGTVTVRDCAFVNWPRDLASRGPALADAIEHDFGERPREIQFFARDTMEIYFLSPSFWRNDVISKEMPKETIPLVEEAGKHVAAFVWTHFARDNGINGFRITFIRMRQENHLGLTRMVGAQVAFEFYNRHMFDPGTNETTMLAIRNLDGE